ncbi:unnamed protein product [Spirodela intermedia]|uniref:Protein kinase domain-containing protein n=1 Tax=Spirodela intermedia TaxID=51605 RepID=A0A7I8ITV5_SPIIN|nr:unnamed protein product [Spirodela intermedia]CAA6661305.1 unnamed protein product [Spirodela intermedia]
MAVPPPSGIFLFLVLCCGLLVHLDGGAAVNEEGQALLRFRSSIAGDSAAALANWNSSDPTPCFWNGITCRDQTVVAINLPRAKLRGSLHPSPWNLSFLRHLNLRSNQFEGPLRLVLSGNSLSGELPVGVGALSYLQILDLSRNAINGSVPTLLTRCRRLRILDLAGNRFSGALPAGFGGAFPLLEKLNLSLNSFSGAVPGDLGNLSALQGTADLSHNLFSGAVPATLGSLPERVYIDLSFNNLSGEIPQSGALVNRGPTAFAGNPALCVGHARLSGGQVAAVVGGDLAAICLIALIFLYCYRQAISAAAMTGGGIAAKARRRREEGDHSELVLLDRHSSFDLEELLKASAFVLGKSSVGIVYKVVLEGGTIMAVRRLGEGGSQRFGEFQAEVEAIGKLRHRNVVPFRAYYWSLDEKLLIYDYIPGGNLSAAVHVKATAALQWRERMKIMKGVARGMAFLHEFSPKRYVHGDLKPSNVLLGVDLEPFIADFGLRRLADIAGGWRREPPEGGAAAYYRAPETARAVKPSQKWDVYSYGVILLELITGRSPPALLSAAGVDLVRWVQLCVEEKKPLAEVLDPTLLQEAEDDSGTAAEAEEEEEIIGALKIALACVQTSPERRPSMHHVLDSLDRLSPRR